MMMTTIGYLNAFAADMEGHSNVTPMGASQQLPLFSAIFLRITFLTALKSFLPCIAWGNTTSGVLKKLHRSLNEQSDLRLQPKWQPAPLKEDTSLVTQLCPPFGKVMKKYQLDTKSTSIQSSPSIIETAPSTLADQDEESEGLVSASEDNIKDTTIRDTGERGLKDKLDNLKKIEAGLTLFAYSISVTLLNIKNQEKMMHLARQN